MGGGLGVVLTTPHRLNVSCSEKKVSFGPGLTLWCDLSKEWWGNLKERDHLGDEDGKIILKWISRKWDIGVWTGSSWFRIATGGGHL